MKFANLKVAVRHAVIAFACLGAPALAEDRELCPERPGLDTPPCIVDVGRVLAEVSAIDWTRDRQAGARTDTILVGDALVRIGLTETLEGQIGWTAYGHVRERGPAVVSRQSDVGDVTAAFKLSLVNPDGSGASLALKPFVTLPTGGDAIGAGTWSAGLLVPVSFDLTDRLQVSLTPEVDAAPDEDRKGRHLAYGSAVGLQDKISDAVTVSVEAQLIRDRDPGGHSTQALSQVSLAWQPGENTQLDIGAVAGLNNASPDLQVIAGVSRRF